MIKKIESNTNNYSDTITTADIKSLQNTIAEAANNICSLIALSIAYQVQISYEGGIDKRKFIPEFNKFADELMAKFIPKKS